MSDADSSPVESLVARTLPLSDDGSEPGSFPRVGVGVGADQASRTRGDIVVVVVEGQEMPASGVDSLGFPDGRDDGAVAHPGLKPVHGVSYQGDRSIAASIAQGHLQREVHRPGFDPPTPAPLAALRNVLGDTNR
ncbi:hypothetical protein JHW43_001914 [Diplocarpon mali]|nr:hypothetical protein JHW43_001914 [Diplocarpon mali]